MKELRFNRLPELSFAVREAINTLCTNIMFSGENVRKIMLTSSHASEGKSFLSLNIVRSLAQMGKKVVLVDADLRKSSFRSRYDIEFAGEAPSKNFASLLASAEKGEESQYEIDFTSKTRGKGLAHFLAGMVAEEDILYATNVPNMFMIPAGREVKNPLSLLNDAKFAQMLEHLQEKMDYVIVDAPPVLLVSDALQIARQCDGTLLVVRSNMVHRQELREATRLLDQNGCNILGTVLNMTRFDNYLSRNYYYRYYYYNNYYHYYYGDSSADAEKPHKQKDTGK